jgi:two-component system nitrogen regulation response regulator NtrX
MLRAILEQEAYDVAEAARATEATRALERLDPHVVLLDLVMPGGPDGLTVLEHIKRNQPHVVVIMMSGRAELDDAVRATRLGAFQFLQKPLTPESVLVTVAAAHDVSRTRAENAELRATLQTHSDIVGQSPAIREIKELIQRVAATPARVLITGESGTGKELIARAIHTNSTRSAKAIISLNCAAMPRDLVESELFGHERGSFTGASRKRRGRFELADGGTLFLDEVGDLSSEAQAKLLRVLETGRFERVGGEHAIAADVRVVAATNRDLHLACRNGEFREDLLYRLNVFPIHSPPLRERTGDVPLLATHFAAVSASRCGRDVPRFTSEALAKLEGHSWPGNVRELANVVERLTILGGSTIEGAEVEAALGRNRSRAGMNALGLSDALADYERQLIQSALAQSSGNVAQAAKSLKTDRANLYRRMHRLRIDQTQKRVD